MSWVARIVGKLTESAFIERIGEAATVLIRGKNSVACQVDVMEKMVKVAGELCKDNSEGVVHVPPVLVIKLRGNPSGYKTCAIVLTNGQMKAIEESPGILDNAELLYNKFRGFKKIPPQTD